MPIRRWCEFFCEVTKSNSSSMYSVKTVFLNQSGQIPTRTAMLIEYIRSQTTPYMFGIVLKRLLSEFWSSCFFPDNCALPNYTFLLPQYIFFHLACSNYRFQKRHTLAQGSGCWHVELQYSPVGFPLKKWSKTAVINKLCLFAFFHIPVLPSWACLGEDDWGTAMASKGKESNMWQAAWSLGPNVFRVEIWPWEIWDGRAKCRSVGTNFHAPESNVVSCEICCIRLLWGFLSRAMLLAQD